MDIFLHQNGAQTGPYTEQQIRDMLKSGVAKEADYAWHDGMTDWLPLGQVLATLTPPPPPPAQPFRPVQQVATPRRVEPAGPNPVLVVVGIVVFLLFAGGIGGVIWYKGRSDAEAQNKVKSAQKELVADLRKSIDNPDPSAGPANVVKDLDRFTQQMGSAADNLQGDKKLEAIAQQHFLQLAGAQLQKYNVAYQALFQAGFTKPNGINTKDDLQHRRDLLKAFGDANEQVAQFYRGAKDTFREELKKQNLSDQTADAMLNSFDKDAQIELVLKIRSFDAQLIEQAGKILDIYDKEWGKWTISSGGGPEFVNAAAADDYNKAYTAIQTLAQQQMALQQQAMHTMESEASGQ